MHWKQKLFTGLGGGICLAFVRLIRDATANSVSLEMLGTALISAVPLCVVAMVVVYAYQPKTLKEAFTTALLAPSMLISIIAGGTTDQQRADLGVVHSVYEAQIWSEALSLFTISTAYAQPTDSVDPTAVRPRAAGTAKVRQIRPEQFRPGVFSRTLRFLGMNQESTDWVYVLRQEPDSASAATMIRTLSERIDTSGWGLEVMHMEGGSTYYLVAGDFGTKSLAAEKQKQIENALTIKAQSATDPTAVELLSWLKGAELKTGRAMTGE